MTREELHSSPCSGFLVRNTLRSTGNLHFCRRPVLLWRKTLMNTLVFTLGEHRSQLTLKISTYPNGNLAIKLYEKDHGILIFGKP